MKFEGARLLVEDFDKAFDFYSKTLGFKVTWGKPGEAYASFSVSDTISLSIFKAELMDESLGIPAGSTRRSMDNSVLIFSVDAVEGIYNRLKDTDTTIVAPPSDRPGWGNRTLHIRDTEGNLIEFSAPLPTERWSDDLLEDAKNYNN